MKKLLNINISDKLMPIILTVLYGVLLVPILRLAFYATPYYDDYNYAIYVKEMWERGHTLSNVLEGTMNAVTTTWNYWQGTYTSIFAMSLMPATWGNDFYYIGIWIIVFMLAIGSFVLGNSISRYVLKASKTNSATIGIILSIVLVETIYSAQQCIYWYNGAVHYTFMHGMMLLFIGLVITFLFDEKKNHWAILFFSLILAFLTSGVNFITTLQGFLILLFVIGIAVIVRNKRWVNTIPILCAYILGMTINLFAPGNAYRQARYEGAGMGAVKSVIMSFVAAFKHFPEFTGLMVIAVLLLFVPIFTNILANITYKFRYPGLVSLFSWCLYATGFTPGYYGMGSAGLSRMFGAIKITLIILLLLNEFYWIGWISNKFVKNKEKIKIGHNIYIYLLATVIVVLSIVFSNAKVEEFLSYGSYYYVHTGEAANYKAEFNYRDEVLSETDGVIELQPLIWRPWFLCKREDISSNPEFEQNKALARWYNVSGVYVKETDNEIQSPQ